MFVKVIRCLVVIAILLGSYYSLSAGARLRHLKQQNRDLRDQTGNLQVGDPDRVYVTAVRDDVPRRGVNEGIVRLWKYRLYYPAGYQPNLLLRNGQVSADSPRAQASGTSSYSSRPLSEPEYETLVLSITRSEGGWKLSRLSKSSSGMTNVADALDFANPDELVIEPLVQPGEGTVSFATDEPVCLLRVRKSIPVESRRQTANDEPLYQGFYYYLVPQSARASFEARMRGEAAR